MTVSPAIVLRSQFVTPSTDDYQKYINYITRDAAKVKAQLQLHEQQENEEGETDQQFSLFYSYMDYMGDGEKQGELFTSTDDILMSEQKATLQQQFQVAQQNGSPMWQDVISFDNAWLVKQGLLDVETGKLDETKMKHAVREAVNVMLKSENMADTAVWSAAIHYNTDNIHVHIAVVEPTPTRRTQRVFNKEKNVWETQYRGKRKQSSLEKMKSKMINQLVDRTNERNQITALIRGSVKMKKDKGIDVATFRKTKKLFQQALAHMPDDMLQWQYGYQTINAARPYIDEITDIYLNKYYRREMKELHRLLDEEVESMKELYGEGSNYERYKQTKLDELKKNMGNAVLAEMREYKKQQYLAEAQAFQRGRNGHYNTRYNSSKELNRAIMNLNYRMRKTYQDYQKERNLNEFDRMLDGGER